MKWYGQCGQDKFASDTLKSKKNGVWFELGCQGYQINSNTYTLEKEYGWRGISIDIDADQTSKWAGQRNTEGLITADALSLDYKAIFKEHNMPKIIDYASIDLEPPKLTLDVLDLIPFDKYKFRVITFEHDNYRDESKSHNVKEKARKIFRDLGYKLVDVQTQKKYYEHIHNAEDWWVLA